MTVNRDEYPSLGALTVFHRAFTVENQEGIWRGVPHPMVQFSDDPESGATQLFIGEGGYAGAYALADIQPDDDRGVWMVRGVIFGGELPPTPEPFVAD